MSYLSRSRDIQRDFPLFRFPSHNFSRRHDITISLITRDNLTVNSSNLLIKNSASREFIHFYKYPRTVFSNNNVSYIQMHLSIPIIIILKVLTRVLVKINKLINLNSNIPSTFSPREIQLTSKRKNVEKERERKSLPRIRPKKKKEAVPQQPSVLRASIGAISPFFRALNRARRSINKNYTVSPRHASGPPSSLPFSSSSVNRNGSNGHDTI